MGDEILRELCSRGSFIFLLIVHSQVIEMSPNTRLDGFLESLHR